MMKRITGKKQVVNEICTTMNKVIHDIQYIFLIYLRFLVLNFSTENNYKE